MEFGSKLSIKGLAKPPNRWWAYVPKLLREWAVDDRSLHPIPMDIATSEVVRSRRSYPPANYIIKIESLSQLRQILLDNGVENYESEIFEASGYKWKLSLYPNGDEERNGGGNISLYLIIAETGALPLGWEVKVNFKMFVFDQIRDEYLTIEEANGKIKRFYEMKTEWGFAQLLPLRVFKDATNGYLVSDKCAFGAEIVVVNYSGKGESISLLKELNAELPYTWKIKEFSSLVDKVLYSDEFTFGECQWRLRLYPNGKGRSKDEYLSLFLEFKGETQGRLHVDFGLRIKDQFNGNHKELNVKRWFFRYGHRRGSSSFLSLDDLKDDSNSFLVNNTLIVEAQIRSIAAVTNFLGVY